MTSPQGVAEAIAERSVPKLFLLNGSIDRETSRRAAGTGPMHASDMVQVRPTWSVSLSSALKCRRLDAWLEFAAAGPIWTGPFMPSGLMKMKTEMRNCAGLISNRTVAIGQCLSNVRSIFASMMLVRPQCSVREGSPGASVTARKKEQLCEPMGSA